VEKVKCAMIRPGRHALTVTDTPFAVRQDRVHSPNHRFCSRPELLVTALWEVETIRIAVAEKISPVLIIDVIASASEKS
jgi:hypothetical protein